MNLSSKASASDKLSQGDVYVFTKVLSLLSVASMFTLLAFTGVNAQEGKGKDIVEIAASDKNFSTLVTAVKAAGLVEALKGDGPFTVFAPTNAAFDKLGKETLEAVIKDKEKLTSILKYHVIAGSVMAKDAVALAKDNKSAKTLQGGEIKLSLEGKKLMLNGTSTVTKANIKAKNGVIHVIDTVILPPTK